MNTTFQLEGCITHVGDVQTIGANGFRTEWRPVKTRSAFLINRAARNAATTQKET